jgi:hypothetical protein
VSTLEIQTPFAVVVHPKMNTGKESVAHAGCGFWRSGFRQKAAILNPRHSLRRSAETPLRYNFQASHMVT